MQINKLIFILVFGIFVWFMPITQAGTPLWSFEALTATTVSVPSNDTATVQYRVTNQTNMARTLEMNPINAVTQITSGLGICSSNFMLAPGDSCVLSLLITGSELTSPVNNGPIVCQQNSAHKCYRPGSEDILSVTQAEANPEANISVTGSPLTLYALQEEVYPIGASGELTINNNSTEITAFNITSNFTDTALEGKVNEVINNCECVAPGGSCTLTYSPGFNVVEQTNFTIAGSNTNTITAAIAIEPYSLINEINPNTGSSLGGTGVTLSGTALTDITSITFDGVPATSINVVNSTTVTAVTPAHAAGVVDIVVTTPSESTTLVDFYTYQTTAIGQSISGGVIACLDGGLQNLIAATADNSAAITWGGFGTATNAQSDTDGDTNTSTIVSMLGNNLKPTNNSNNVSILGSSGGTLYAAQLCADYEVDSQGNTPCEAGNACYNDWFLPARTQLNCLYINNAAIGGFISNAAYWTSTEANSSNAWYEYFSNGFENNANKALEFRARCVRNFPDSGLS